jgi:crotonobetainyl-CoA:carnitine CoA-transferase CaiB-like acyl-CoA transferase
LRPCWIKAKATREGPEVTTPPGPLNGVRVLDLTAVVMGPLATQILGDLGADVITVENRQGDINRTMTRGLVRGLSGVSMNLLRNKRNITLDVAHPAGRRRWPGSTTVRFWLRPA